MDALVLIVLPIFFPTTKSRSGNGRSPLGGSARIGATLTGGGGLELGKFLVKSIIAARRAKFEAMYVSIFARLRKPLARPHPLTLYYERHVATSSEFLRVSISFHGGLFINHIN
jgi:hypothetical protein